MDIYGNKGNWTCAFTYTDHKGIKRKKTKSGFKVKRDAIDWKNKFIKQFQLRQNSFDDLVKDYLEDLSVRCKVTTFYATKSLIERWILPDFKGNKLNQITLIDIRKWQNKIISNEKIKISTKHQINTKFSILLNYAVSFYDLKENFLKKTRLNLRSFKQMKIQFWTYEQYNKFHRVVSEEPLFNEYILLFDILYYTGIRRGELLALRLKDIDLDKKQFHIEQNRPHCAPISTPKTISSQRDVLIPDSLIKSLQNVICNISDENQLIFKNVKPAKLSYVFLKIHERLSEKLTLPKIKLHDLRHSHASLLIDLGISYQAVADRLGHANSEMVIKTYSHLFLNRRSELIDSLNNLIERSTK